LGAVFQKTVKAALLSSTAAGSTADHPECPPKLIPRRSPYPLGFVELVVVLLLCDLSNFLSPSAANAISQRNEKRLPTTTEQIPQNSHRPTITQFLTIAATKVPKITTSSISQSRLAGFTSFLVKRVVELLPPRVPRAVNQHVDHNSSIPPSTSPTLGPESPNGPEQLEGSLYFWVLLKSLKHAIVVLYNPDDAERARQATNRYYFPPTASTPEITLRVFRDEYAVLAPFQVSVPPSDRFYDVESSRMTRP
jgi:hypothetical protein